MTVRIERCALSDLPADQCGCVKHRPDGGAIAIEPVQSNRTAGHAYGPEIQARHPGRCPECAERYEVGEPIRPERYKTVNAGTGRWLHTECAEEA